MQKDSSTYGGWGTQGTVEEFIMRLLLKCSDLENMKDGFLSLEYSERVDCAYNRLKNVRMYKETLSFPPVSKSNESSNKYRICGNEYFNTRKYYDAFEMYTKSITFAENGSESLALAYGNRSAVLFQRKYYRECLKDIERALNYDIPEKTRRKLMIRKEKAEELKRNQHPIILYNHAPPITKTNPLIPNASASVKIQHNPKYGRHIVATENINAGDVISVEDTFVHVIHDQSKYQHCHQCLELSYNLIPCNKCTNTLYCGDDCLNKAQSGYHKYECDFPPILQYPGVLFIHKTLKGLDELQNEAAVETDGIYRSDSFKAVLAQQTHEDKRDFIHLAIPAIVACIAYQCLRNNPEFKLKYNVDPKIIKEYLYKTFMTDDFKLNIEKREFAHEDVHSMTVGTGTYSFTSLFNHSCVPNCGVYMHGRLMVIRAIATILKGEECCVTYWMNFARADYRQRHRLLKEKFFFDCDCRACVNRWPVFSELPRGPNLPLSFEVKWSMNTFEKSDANRKLVKELLAEGLHLLKEMKKFEPCQNYLKLQNMLSVIYNYEGLAHLEF